MPNVKITNSKGFSTTVCVEKQDLIGGAIARVYGRQYRLDMAGYPRVSNGVAVGMLVEEPGNNGLRFHTRQPFPPRKAPERITVEVLEA